jgi:hypothetical protein
LPHGPPRGERVRLAATKPHGHKYAIDALLAVVALRQKGQVTVFTSDVDDLEKLVALIPVHATSAR